jgi:transcriptional regulator of arginine metabolism
MYKLFMKITQHLRRMLSEGITGNQVELVELLKERGVNTTQSTVSRALKKINAVKGTDKTGNIIYFLPKAKETVKQPGFFGSLVSRILHNQQMIMVHTRPGTAMTVAKFIDDQDFDEVLGTIAGDDTIMIVPSDVTRTANISKMLERYFFETGLLI